MDKTSQIKPNSKCSKRTGHTQATSNMTKRSSTMSKNKDDKTNFMTLNLSKLAKPDS